MLWGIREIMHIASFVTGDFVPGYFIVHVDY